MIRHLHSLSTIVLAMVLIGTTRWAQAQLSESPITPGFWSFANRKSETTREVVAACRNYIEIRLMVTDTPFTNAPFDAFPVHCPDDVVWSILNEVGRSK
jgi:hypothetical protein